MGPGVEQRDAARSANEKGYESGSRAFRSQNVPLTLGPGRSVEVRVTLETAIEEKNYEDSITLILQKSVEGMARLTIPVVVNPEEKAVDEYPPGLSPRELEELLKKARTIKP